MDRNTEDQIIENTEEISENTEEIVQIVTKQYNLDRHKRMWDALFYAHQRMDILIISVSGGGIYVCLEAAKYLREDNYLITSDLITSAIAFVLAIITNFAAQKLSSEVYVCEYAISNIEVFCDEAELNPDNYKDEISQHKEKAKKIEKWNKYSNMISILTMLIGLIFLVIFFLFTF